MQPRVKISKERKNKKKNLGYRNVRLQIIDFYTFTQAKQEVDFLLYNHFNYLRKNCALHSVTFLQLKNSQSTCLYLLYLCFCLTLYMDMDCSTRSDL